MARKQKHEEHENHERWLVSYADFITLLFAFFVVMYSVSSVNEGKYRVLSESMTASFRAQAKSLAPIQHGRPAKTSAQDQFSIVSKPQVIRLSRDIDPKRRSFATDRILPDSVANRATLKQYGSVDRGEEGKYVLVDKKTSGGADQKSKESKIASLGQISSEIEESMKTLVQEGIINIRRHETWLEIEINTGILFYSGSATVSDEAQDVLFKLARILAPQPNSIEVEGHTDNQPIKTTVFPSNWELSAARAATVVRMLSDYGVEPRRMQATGFGDNRPLVNNSTEENRARNRRVILVVNALPENQPQEDESDIIPPQQLDKTTLAKDDLNPNERQIGVIPPKPKPAPVAKAVRPAPVADQPAPPPPAEKPKPVVQLTEDDFLNSGPYLPGQHPDDIAAKLAEEQASQAQVDSSAQAMAKGPVFQRPTTDINTGIGTMQPIPSPFGLQSPIQLKPFPLPGSSKVSGANTDTTVAP